MALALNDRVQQTGTANTTVSFTLAGSVAGFQSFAVVGNGNTTYYSSFDATGNWEVGVGTYSNGATGATQAAGPTAGSWATNGSLIGSNVTWYSASDTGYTAGDYVLLFDQTAGSSFFYYGQITLIQFAGGFGFAFHADILSSGGVPNGNPSSSWIMQESTGTTLTRTTILASSNSGSAVTFTGTVNVFVTYPSEKSVNLDGSNNVSALGTIASGTWQGTTVAVAYGGTGVTSSSGANSVMIRDANQNVSINRLNQSNTSIAAAGGTTALTAASSYSQTLTGTGNQTYTMPDATTLSTGVAFGFNNNATGTLTLQDYATGSIGTITSGGAIELVLVSNATVAGIWDYHGYLPENVTWGTNALNMNSTVITGGTWQGGTIASNYGGTGLTSYAVGDISYYVSGTALSKLPIGANGAILTSNGTGPTWVASSAASIDDAYYLAFMMG